MAEQVEQLGKHGLVGYVWEPADEKNPAGLVVIFHGYGAHGKYGTILFAAEMLAANGFAVVSGDLRGFGKSPGQPGFVDSVDSLLEDCIDIAEYARARFPTLKAFCMGSSMGGNFALRVADKFDGCVLLAPMILVEKPPAWQMPFLEVAAAIPGLRSLGVLSPAGLASDKQYRDPERRAICDEDPLGYHGKMCLATGKALLTASLELEASLAEVATPFLCVHGDADEIVSLEGSKLLVEKAKTQDKTLSVYPNMLHAPLCEFPEVRSKVEQEILSWLRERV